MTPHEFLTLRRIDLAKRLLARGEMSVTEVCMEAGYASLGSFSAKFHSVVGSSPSEYQREIRRAFGFAAPWRIAFVPVCFLGRFAGLQY